MDRLPQRDDLIYKEIEEFQDYELTNCIAYEMAVRNTESNKIIRKLKKIKKIRISLSRRKRKEKKYFSRLKKTPIVLNEMIEKILEIRLKSKYGININYSQINNSLIRRVTPIFRESRFDQLLNINEQFRHKIKSFYRLKDGYFIEQVYNRKREIKSEITTNFKRELKINNTPSIKIELNPNLPKEELIAYISKIKDEYDKNNSIIKTPLELLGETLEKSDNKKTPKKPKASVYADWFYIYDYWKYEKIQGKTDKDIFVALEVENNVPYKEDMLRKIRDKMKYFIDDLGYKELISGVKNS